MKTLLCHNLTLKPIQQIAYLCFCRYLLSAVKSLQRAASYYFMVHSYKYTIIYHHFSWTCEIKQNKLLSASSRVGVQRQSRSHWLPHPVLKGRIQRRGSFPCHHGPAGERVHHRRPGGVDRVRGQSSGRQRHWFWTLEPGSPRQD